MSRTQLILVLCAIGYIHVVVCWGDWREARCEGSHHNCDWSNPCSPDLCVDDQLYYNAKYSTGYINCTTECESQQCPDETRWNLNSQQCVHRSQDWGVTAGPWYSLDHSNENFEIRCERSGTFNCDNRNPCAPTLCWHAMKYPGISTDAYVLCGSEGECAELTCPSPHVFNEEQQECLPAADFEIRCERSAPFNCDVRNPCAPTLCWDAMQYPGISRDAYVLCGSVGECTELTCPSPHVFNEEHQECLPAAVWGVTAGPWLTLDHSNENFEIRCQRSGTFNCGHRNPCAPTLCWHAMKYPGIAREAYVLCGSVGECAELTCPLPHVFHEDQQECLPAAGWGVTAGPWFTLDFSNEKFEIRCERSGTFNCDYRNPCAPKLCWDALKYPGISTDAYVLCGSVGECAELTCSQHHVFHEDQQECLPAAE